MSGEIFLKKDTRSIHFCTTMICGNIAGPLVRSIWPHDAPQVLLEQAYKQLKNIPYRKQQLVFDYLPLCFFMQLDQIWDTWSLPTLFKLFCFNIAAATSDKYWKFEQRQEWQKGGEWSWEKQHNPPFDQGPARLPLALHCCKGLFRSMSPGW